MSTPIAAMVEELFALGASPEVVVIAVRGLEKQIYGRHDRSVDRSRRALARPAPAAPLRMHFVYALIDSRNQAPFYIGVTLNPSERMSQHRSDPSSSAYAAISQIVAGGGVVSMKLLEKFSSRQDALDREHNLINSVPGLINKDRRKITLTVVN